MNTHTYSLHAKRTGSQICVCVKLMVWVLGLFALSACGEPATGAADAISGAADHWRCSGWCGGCLYGKTLFCEECESHVSVGVGAPGGPAPTVAEISSAARLESGLYRTALFIEASRSPDWPALATIVKVRAIGTQPGVTSIDCIERNSGEDCNTVTDWQKLWPGGTSSADHWEQYSAGLPCENTTTIELELNWPVSQGKALSEGGLFFEIEYRRNSYTPDTDVVRY